MELVPLKVKILIKGSEWSVHKERGHAKYPQFNELQCVRSSGVDWSSYVDTEGGGWHYDKLCGHKQEEPDSPRGMQWGCLLVPQEFAEQAEEMFPAEVEIISESEFESFYNNRAHVYESDENINKDIVDGIRVKQALGFKLTTSQERALDPEDPTPGIVKNRKKEFFGYKQDTGITIKPDIISKVSENNKFDYQIANKTLLSKYKI